MGKGILIIIFSIFTVVSFSQETGSISGRITDAEMDLEPLLFAHINLKDSDVSVQTNFHGNFEIEGISPGKHILTVSFPGYERLEIPVTVVVNQNTRIERSLSAMSIHYKNTPLTDTAATAVDQATQTFLEN